MRALMAIFLFFMVTVPPVSIVHATKGLEEITEDQLDAWLQCLERNGDVCLQAFDKCPDRLQKELASRLKTGQIDRAKFERSSIKIINKCMKTFKSCQLRVEDLCKKELGW